MAVTSEFEPGDWMTKPATTNKCARYIKTGDRVLFTTSNGLIGDGRWEIYGYKIVVGVENYDEAPLIIVHYAMPGKVREEPVYYHANDILQLLVEDDQ